MQKFPVNVRLSFVRIAWAASATMAGERARRRTASPPRTLSAAASMTVLGHTALNAIPASRNSSAIPRTQRLMATFEAVYAECSRNQRGARRGGGERFRTWGFAAIRRWGRHARGHEGGGGGRGGGGRGEVQDVGVRGNPQVGEACAGAQERAAHVHVEQEVVPFHRGLKGAREMDRGRVVHEDVDPSEALDGPGDGGLDLVVEPDVARDREGAAPRVLDLLLGRMDRPGELRVGLRRLP